MLDLKASEGLATSESFALGVAVGLGFGLDRLGRAYALSDGEAARVRDRIRAHYRRQPAKAPGPARATA